MASDNLKLGGVEVDIEMPTDKLDKDTKKAEKVLRDLEKKTEKATAAMAAAFTKTQIAVGTALTALAYSVYRTIESADALQKLSERLGIGVEALSKLEFAAKRSDVEVSSLTTALTLLNRQINERDEMSEAVRTFTALGVATRDAAGNTRDAGSVLADIAEKFSTYRDGAEKTALAITLFGRAGAELIPMLNGGKEGLAALGKEAERAGVVIDEELVKKSKLFKDELDKVWDVLVGFTNNLTKAVLPTLTVMAERFLFIAEKSGIADAAMKALSFTFKTLVTGGLILTSVFEAVGSVLSTVAGALALVGKGEFSEAFERLKEGGTNLSLVWQQLDKDIARIWGLMKEEGPKAAEVMTEKVAPPIVQSAQDITNALEEMRKANQYAFEDLMNNPTEEAANKLAALEAMVKRGAISWRQYSAAVEQVNDQTAANMDSLASNVSTALTSIFKESKAASIAAAIINTYQGVTKALAELPFPFNYAQAAAVAAMGFAQVASIRSTNQNGTGGGGKAAGGGAAASAPAAAPQQQQTGPSQTMYLQGLDPKALYSGESMRGLAEAMIQYQRDGGKIVLGAA